MIEEIWKHMEGTDASNDISLLEYGLLVAPGNIVNPEQCEAEGEYFCVYRISDGQYGTGYIKERELHDLIDGKDWMKREDIDAFLSHCGYGEMPEDFKELQFVTKLQDLLNYWGPENIFGTDYSPMSAEEAAQRYLNPDAEGADEEDEEERGECDILCDENRGIFIPYVFAEMYGHMLIPQDKSTTPEEIKEAVENLRKGPDHEGYWESMAWIENACLLQVSGKLWDIEQNGDLWAYEHGKRRPEGHDGE